MREKKVKGSLPASLWAIRNWWTCFLRHEFPSGLDRSARFVADGGSFVRWAGVVRALDGCILSQDADECTGADGS